MTTHIDVLGLYRTMQTRDLRLLREALELDKAAARRVSTVSFCDQRIAWIDHALRERQRDDQHR